jgi:type IV secretion system protein VirB6
MMAQAAPAAGVSQGARGAPNVAHLQALDQSTTDGERQAASGAVRRRVTTRVAGGGVEPLQLRVQDRARGIGSRFRAASNDSGRAMLKGMAKEKMK